MKKGARRSSYTTVASNERLLKKLLLSLPGRLSVIARAFWFAAVKSIGIANASLFVTMLSLLIRSNEQEKLEERCEPRYNQG